MLSIIGYWLCYTRSELCDWAFIPQALCVTIFVLLGHNYYKLNHKNRWLLAAAIVTLPFYVYSVVIDEYISLADLQMGPNYLVYVADAVFGISVVMLISLYIQRFRASGFLNVLGVYSLYIFGLHANNSFLNPLLQKTMCLLGNEDVASYSTSITYGLVKTFYCIIITLAIGWLLKRYLPFFFGYRKDDKWLLKLKTNNEYVKR